MTDRKQLVFFLVLLVVYALCAFITYAFFADQLAATTGMRMPETNISSVMLGLANAGIVLIIYGLLGLIGYGFARKLDFSGVFSPDTNWRR